MSYADEDHETLTAKRGDAYIEWGVTDAWTLTGKYERVDFDESNVFDSDGWRTTIRRRLWSSQGFSTVVEAGVLEGAAIGGFQGCESLGLEVSSGIGYSKPTLIADFFMGVTVARREHQDDCFRNRAEWVFGLVEPDGSAWTAQLWSERGKGTVSDKVEIQWSRRFGSFEPAFALRTEYGGAFDESAAVISLVYRYGNL